MKKDKNNTASVSMDFAGKQLSFETGKFAPQATSSIMARLGDTVVLVTVVAGRIRDDIDYFPLSVEYTEKLYAGGRIKGSRWVKREGRPTDEAILIGRLIDRSIRPLFPKEFKNEVQIVITVLSVDGEHEPDILALNAVSAALAISPIPWNGPIGAIRVGTAKNPEDNSIELVLNPTVTEGQNSDLDIVASQSNDLTVMLEAGALQVPEDIVHQAIVAAHDETRKVIGFIEDLVKQVGQPKRSVVPNPIMIAAIAVVEEYKKEVEGLIENRANKEGSGSETEELVAKIYEDEKLKTPATVLDKKIIGKAVEYVMFKSIRKNVVEKKQRPDGRKLDVIRQLNVEVGILPRTHGSALFERGLTQALSIVTLGSPRMEQLIESAEGEETKRYIHHYSGPPYSVGEAGRIGTPSRREIGHGALAERALFAVIPAKDKFPYTIRVVSEVLSQNGSSSMASTCGSTLALMDAGVPILKPVGGISIGMMSLSADKYELLTDIIGLEDFSGDMDFKVAGTDTGITAIQLDVKIPGLTDAQIAEIFKRARVARLFILEKMQAVIASPRSALSTYAPKIETLHIPVDKIGEVIGPGGKIIKNIIAQTGATVDVEDDGTVTVTGTSDEAVQKAYDWVKGIVREVAIGEEFEGSVKRILSFGAFVEFLPGKEGMVHVSQMAVGFVKNPEDVVHIGQVVKVRVIQIDDQGRVNLSMLFGDDAKEKENNGGGASGSRQPREFKPREFQPREFQPREPHPLTQQFMRENREKRQTDRFGARPRRKTHI